MGQVFARTYFPNGWSEFVNRMQLEDVGIDMPPENEYNFFVNEEESQKMLNEIFTHYTELRELADKDVSLYIEKVTNEVDDDDDKSGLGHRKSIGRRVYDPLVAERYCRFWKELLKQPRENMKTFYYEGRPKAEETFYEIEKFYGLLKYGHSAQGTICGYKQNT